MFRVDEIHPGVVRELGICAVGGEAGTEDRRCDGGVVEGAADVGVSRATARLLGAVRGSFRASKEESDKAEELHF